LFNTQPAVQRYIPMTVLVSASHESQRNIMAAVWAMPLDFEPQKVMVILAKFVWTRQLLEASGTFVTM